MVPIDWDKLAQNAANQSDKNFISELASLTDLKTSEIDSFIAESNIINSNLIKVLQEIKDATKSNADKADVISNIENGVEFLISLASKIIKL